MLPKGFVYLKDIIPDIEEDMRYAGNDNFVGTVIDGYRAPRAIMTKESAEALKNAAEDFALMGLHIRVFDAYRPARAVRHFVRWAQDENDVKMRDKYYPEITDKRDILRLGYVAGQSSHSRGSTIDLTLVDQDGQALEMGTDFDYFGKRAGHGSADISEKAQENRAALCKLMIAAGFKPYAEEWWHYTLGDEPYPDTYFDFEVE